MNKDDMKHRTKQFALDVIKCVESLPKGKTTDVLGRQLLRSGTSVGANYRAACRAKSTADFISKMGIVEEEADEAMYLLDGITDRRRFCRFKFIGIIDERSGRDSRNYGIINQECQNEDKEVMNDSEIRNPQLTIP